MTELRNNLITLLKRNDLQGFIDQPFDYHRIELHGQTNVAIVDYDRQAKQLKFDLDKPTQSDIIVAQLLDQQGQILSTKIYQPNSKKKQLITELPAIIVINLIEAKGQVTRGLLYSNFHLCSDLERLIAIKPVSVKNRPTIIPAVQPLTVNPPLIQPLTIKPLAVQRPVIIPAANGRSGTTLSTFKFQILPAKINS